VSSDSSHPGQCLERFASSFHSLEEILMNHRKLHAMAAIPVLVLWLTGRAPAQPFADDRVLVSFHPGAAADAIQAAHGQAGGQVVKTLDALGVQVVSVQAGTVERAIQAYQKNPNVKFAEPNYRRLLFRPVTREGSEPGLGIANNFDEQWGLHNTGQSFGAVIDPLFGTLTAPAYTGIPDADIDAPEGWAITHGSPDIRIAILDSGVSCAHADLSSKCIEQLNFVDEHGSPVDDLLGHGTHVAAIAAAETDNGVGTAGVAREATIGSFKVCYEDYTFAIFGIVLSYCEDEDIADAIVQAANSGYHVINMSLAGPEPSTTLESAVDHAWNQGVVVVAGAGNAYSPAKQYPAAFQNVIAVGATDWYDNQAFFSSFSTDSDDWVSVAAPGDVILSAVPGELCGVAPDHPEGCYDWKSGTSMSAPHVAGIAAMLCAQRPEATNAEIRAIIEQSAEEVGAMGQNLLAWTKHGRVNLHLALTHAGGDPPPPPGGDTTPPVISNVLVTKPNNSPRFVVTWQTDEPATSVVTFATGQSASNDTLVTSHRMEFRGERGVTYEIDVSSTDAAGNTSVAGPFFHTN
jgi:thermitase